MLKSKGIRWFATKNETKSQIVERFNRTLKDSMFRYFTTNKTKRWLSVLPKLVENYNTSYHRSIKMTPVEASMKNNQSAVWHNLYAGGVPEGLNSSNLKVGDQVRIFKLRGKFKRRYAPNYTDKLFVIDKVLPTHPPAYTIVDMKGEPVIGTFYK